MILYTLKCKEDHSFESWFRNSQSFDAQKEKKLIHCPICGISEISKAVMAPRIGKKQSTLDSSSQTDLGKAHLAVQEIKTYLKKHATNVGNDLYNQAQKMNDGDIPPKSIYGRATVEQVKDLEDQDIAILPLPWVDREDA